MIKKSLRESEKPLNDFKVVWNNFKAYKEAVLGEAATYKDACQIREAVAAANKKGIFLKEAQIPTKTNRIVESEEKEEKGKKEECECKKGEECKESASLKEDIAPAPAPEGVPAPEAPAPTAAPAVSPDVQQQISALQAALDALKASAGIETNDFAAAPTADIPAVTGQNPGAAEPAPEPIADAAQPVMEAFEAMRAAGEKIDEAAIKKVMTEKGTALLEEVGERANRIAFRSAKLDVLDEHYKGDMAKAYLTHLGVLQESKDDWEYIPSEKDLAKGYASGPAAKEIKPAKTWPTKDIPASETKDLKKTKESAEEPVAPEATTKISESEVTNRYVESYFAPKLSMDSLRESMGKGILG